jgi:hypothetical protein
MSTLDRDFGDESGDVAGWKREHLRFHIANAPEHRGATIEELAAVLDDCLAALAVDPTMMEWAWDWRTLVARGRWIKRERGKQ